jgi:putative PIN family toxin of toxin-antitoxin system
MMRAVFDSNVLAAWFAAETGTLRELIDRWYGGQFELSISEAILTEVLGAWTIPYWRNRMREPEKAIALSALREFAIWTKVSEIVRGIAPHPEDDAVLATAVSANADYLVTGDKQLLAIGYYEGTRIVSPREFLTILEQTEE